jgi:hypothetical protein
MATQTHVTLIDDIDGSNAAETVAFGLDGADYEIDLNEKNAKKLRDVLAVYTANARQVGGRRNRSRPGRAVKPARSGSSKEQLAAIRDWARGQGYEVSDRGRLSAAVVQAFEDAH